MNKKKTQVMFNKFVPQPPPIYIDGHILEPVNSYTYLGQQITIDEGQTKEIQRRIGIAWSKFGKLARYFKNEKFPISLKRKIFNQCIKPVFMYGSETWAMTKRMEMKIRSSQMCMERQMLGIKWSDHVRNETVRDKTKIDDILVKIKAAKWTWAGHLTRADALSNWAAALLEWKPGGKRNVGRQKKRWVDEIVKFNGNWKELAKDRVVWRMEREAFTQQWVADG